MTMDISNKLIRIGNYFTIGMPIYRATVEGKVLTYTLDEIKINILRNDLAVIHFMCTDNSTDNFEEISYIDFEEKEAFIDFDKAQEQATRNFMKYFGYEKKGGN